MSDIIEDMISARVRGLGPPPNWAQRAEDEIARLRTENAWLREYKEEVAETFELAQELDTEAPDVAGSFTGTPRERIARQVARMRAELAAVRADAERYRWLREAIDHGPLALCEEAAGEPYRWSPIASYCEEFVDAARGGQQ